MEEKELDLVRGIFKDADGNFIGQTRTVSIVTDPAIELSFQLFKNLELNKHLFSVVPDKMEVVGPAMIPDTKILRQREDGSFYNIFFTKEDVKDAAFVYLRKANINSANLEHKQNFTDKIQLFESWFMEDREKDRSAFLGFDNSKIPLGTWFINYKILDKELWDEIKNGDFTGFSVEIGCAEMEYFGKKSLFNDDEEADKVEYRGKHKLIYNLVQDILATTDIDDQAKYKFISRILSKL